ncbi:carboxymuconolactone decarboxylase family protein [Synergistaceae bacterium OttesenSCG-928-I11]|nr:carboxymuconolactone decarboxylase family protein [Synergistaceae bacterium OttesenSCG-928-I11]
MAENATKPMPKHWQIMKEMNEEMNEKTAAWRDAVSGSGNTTFTPKEKQLIILAMCCAIRHLNGVKAHAGHAMKAGATKEELFAVAALSMIIGGCPSYGESIKVIEEVWSQNA